MVKNLPAMQETRVQSLGREDPPEKGMATTPTFMPGEFLGQGSLVDYSPWGHKGSDTTEPLVHLHSSVSNLNCKLSFMICPTYSLGHGC